ncbi:MAG TPA: hypothetical protein VJL87_06990 [Bdellovibrionota bacterium]|nr:hypothetical protein [Bdellovibrionota bacterium]
MLITNVLLLFFLPVTFTSNQSMVSKFPQYPYGLLTDDYGILTENDLKQNADRAGPKPYSLNSHAYEYWQCFPVKDISFFCEYFEVDDPQKPFADTHVRINLKGHFHEYITRRPWDQSMCHQMIRDFKTLVRNSNAACISGPFPQEEDGNVYWTFGRLKTKKGCVSYFIGECEEQGRSH